MISVWRSFAPPASDEPKRFEASEVRTVGRGCSDRALRWGVDLVRIRAFSVTTRRLGRPPRPFGRLRAGSSAKCAFVSQVRDAPRGEARSELYSTALAHLSGFVSRGSRCVVHRRDRAAATEATSPTCLRVEKSPRSLVDKVSEARVASANPRARAETCRDSHVFPLPAGPAPRSLHGPPAPRRTSRVNWRFKEPR